MLASSSGTHVLSWLEVGLRSPFVFDASPLPLPSWSLQSFLLQSDSPGFSVFSQLLPLVMIDVGLGELSLQLVFETFARGPMVTLALT